MQLIFVADPMCSWCYGFAKELTTFSRAHPDLPLHIVVGGLRAGDTTVLDDEGKNFRLGHWARVEAASGLPFNREAFLARQGFVYDTEPICRAVVTARKLAPQTDLLAVFRALQHAFYVDGLDTTDGTVLAEVGAAALQDNGQAVTAEQFLAVWQAEATLGEAQTDFLHARRWGVRSFPALLIEIAGQLHTLSPGYAPADKLEANLRALLSV
ncbi:hypothetical protein [Chitinimonas sp.]|uniref:DsbA family protein n=1 Tax=Chitinimonas sp. TaxID=1934313 RepID=UPI002F93E2F2